MNDKQCNNYLLERGLESLDLSVSATQITALQRHLELLQQWNRRINLTAITAPEAQVTEHLLDSLSIASYLHGMRILDVGSGGGFPGLPLALLLPERQFTLLDSRAKRVGFLLHVCRELDLDNVELVNKRIESYRPEQKFDTLTARAFSSLVDFYRLTEHLHYPGLRLVAMKGKRPQVELDRLERYAAVKTQVLPLVVPGLAASRHLIIINL